MCPSPPTTTPSCLIRSLRSKDEVRVQVKEALYCGSGRLSLIRFFLLSPPPRASGRKFSFRRLSHKWRWARGGQRVSRRSRIRYLRRSRAGCWSVYSVRLKGCRVSITKIPWLRRVCHLRFQDLLDSKTFEPHPSDLNPFGARCGGLCPIENSAGVVCPFKSPA